MRGDRKVERAEAFQPLREGFAIVRKKEHDRTSGRPRDKKKSYEKFWRLLPAVRGAAMRSESWPRV